MSKSSELADRLWYGTSHQSAHRRAAVNLLIEHQHWLTRGDFVDMAVHDDTTGGEATVLWDNAADFLDERPRASTSELAVLHTACVLGQDTLQFGVMGRGHRAMLRRAFDAALADTPEGGE